MQETHSPTLALGPSDIKMFCNFKSRCTYPQWANHAMPWATSFAICSRMACASGGSLFADMYAERSPCLQKSVTMPRCEGTMAIIWSRFGWARAARHATSFLNSLRICKCTAIVSENNLYNPSFEQRWHLSSCKQRWHLSSCKQRWHLSIVKLLCFLSIWAVYLSGWLLKQSFVYSDSKGLSTLTAKVCQLWNQRFVKTLTPKFELICRHITWRVSCRELFFQSTIQQQRERENSLYCTLKTMCYLKWPTWFMRENSLYNNVIMTWERIASIIMSSWHERE